MTEKFRFARSRALHITALAALVLAAVGVFFFAPDSGTKVSAQEGIRYSSDVNDMAMLSYALNFRSAHNFAVYGDKGVVNEGESLVRGNVGRNSGEIRGLSAEKIQGRTQGNDEGLRADQSRDLARAMSAMRQLPCTEIQDGNLNGKTFGPGVYCLPSSSLAGRMTIDGEGNPNSIFIFRVKGGLETAPDSEVAVINGARSSYAFFAVEGAINVGSRTRMNAALIADGPITIASGSEVRSKVISTGDRVSSTESNLGDGTGFVEICKEQRAGTTGLENLRFVFDIVGDSQNIQVPIGNCSAPIEVAAGPVTIIEEAVALQPNNLPFTNFRLFDVVTDPAGAIISENYPTRTAIVNVAAGTVANETIVTFINEFAIVGVIEICKRPLDVDVNGFFNFTVDAIRGVIFPVPVGECTPPITVLAPATPPGASTTIRVTELGRANFDLESVTTFPANRFISLTQDQGVANDGSGVIFPNPGGGFATVTMVAGGVQQETVINFFNRTAPGRLKVCKIAGPGVALNTPFTFEVRGQAGPGPGTPVTRTVVVPAGPADQGGFCEFVEGRFVIGTPILITETGPTTIGGNLVLVSRIRSTSGFVTPPVTVQGTTLTTNPDLPNRRAVVPARFETVVVDFTNFVFRPTVLKICKIAGPGVAVGTPFTFDIVANENSIPGTVPTVTATPLTIQAGPAATGGTCDFVDGPYPAVPTEFGDFGTFNIGSTVTVTERATGNTTVTAITGVPNPAINVNLAGRAGSQLLAANVNVLTFTNTFIPPVPTAGVRADFDGNGSSDLAVFNPGSGEWRVSTTGANRAQSSRTFGAAGDTLVPGDYDGDRKTDHAVYRDGAWRILRSTTNTTLNVDWGQPGDMPLAADFDGDLRSDVAAYRPSTGQWFILRSSNGAADIITWGGSSDLVVPGNYDGDNKADIAVYRPSNGTWYVLKSTGGGFAAPWGAAGDRPVHADYDGDGKIDLAVYRPSQGNWFIFRSSDQGYDVINWGNSTDVPVPGDYDNDGRYDVAVYRAGTWYVLQSGDGSVLTRQHGTADDIPVEVEYLP